MVANQTITSDGFTVNVIYTSGQSTRGDGACAQGEPTENQYSVINGGTVTLWEKWGTNATDSAGNSVAGQPCTISSNGDWTHIIAHELGHVLGFDNSSCGNSYLMGGGLEPKSNRARPK